MISHRKGLCQFFRRGFPCGLGVLFVFSGPGFRGAQAAETVDFNRDIRRVLSDNCFKCHGPDANARKGDLRFDVLDPKLRRAR